jgi:thiosulfate/3-mercaptopyruvate sulfurtransferase
LLATAAIVVLPYKGRGQQAAPLLVNEAWLAANLNDPKLVLLHVGDKNEYTASHIPGARYITMNDVSTPHDMAKLVLEMPEPEVLRAKLESFGISDDSRIVVYYGNDWVSPATRIILTLDYLGLGRQTSLLNGGMGAWKKAGRSVTADVPVVKPGRLAARPVRNIIVDADFVNALATKPNHKLVDGRSAVIYKGIEPTYEKSGHIPGAANIPFSDIADENLWIDPVRVEKLFRDAGIKPGDTVVGYCHIGQQATAMLFGARLIGHEVRLYDGSFQDWATRNRGAVEK